MALPTPARVQERTGAQIFVEQLKIHGAEVVFCVPGESYLAILDALYDASESIKLITCRQEGGAAYAADAYGKLTGKPGICLVTRGPGASNAAAGLHTARQDSTPLLLCIGQVPRRQSNREAFQEIDYRAMFGSIAKWVEQIEDARRIPEVVSRAMQIATSGRPGPVVLVLPEDMQRDLVVTTDAATYQPASAAPTPQSIETLWQLLREAERPMMLLGREGWTAPEALTQIETFASDNALPAAVSFRAQDQFNNDHPNYVGALGVGGNPKLNQRMREADLILMIGTRPDALTVNRYELMEVPRPQQKLIHVYPDPNEIGRVYQPHLAICSTTAEFAAAVAAGPTIDGSHRLTWLHEARRDFEEYIVPTPTPGDVNLGEVLAFLRARLPHDTIISNGAGNYTAWCHRYLLFRRPGTQLAPINGTMGYGVPAAVGAQLLFPDRTVICIAGDGCFLMNGQEFATAVRYNLPIICVVVNNNMLGTIRMHQELHFPGRVSGTMLTNPNFAAYAEAFGGHGEVVEKTGDFPAAFERAIVAKKPAILELRVDPEALSVARTLSEVRAGREK